MEGRRSLDDVDDDADADDEAGRTSSTMERRLGKSYSACALAEVSCIGRSELRLNFSTVFMSGETSTRR